MLLVTHLWQVTNELANPFGQSAYTLYQKLQTQGVFLLCWFISLHSKDVSILDKFLLDKPDGFGIYSEFLFSQNSGIFCLTKFRLNESSKITKDVSSLPSISFYCIPFLVRIIRKADGSGIVQKFQSEFHSLKQPASYNAFKIDPWKNVPSI